MPKGKGPISRLINTWQQRQTRLDPTEHAVWQNTVTQLWIEADVRVDPRFVERLDAQLRDECGPAGEPSRIDFLRFELPAIEEEFALRSATFPSSSPAAWTTTRS